MENSADMDMWWPGRDPLPIAWHLEVIPTWWLNWFHSDLPFFVQKSKKSKFHKTFTKKPYSCLVTPVFFLGTQKHVDFNLSSNPFCKPFLGVEAFVEKNNGHQTPTSSLPVWYKRTKKCPKSQTKNTTSTTGEYVILVTLDFWRLWIIYSIRAMFKPWRSMKSWLFHRDPYNRSIRIPAYTYISLEVVFHQTTANNEGFCSLLNLLSRISTTIYLQ